VLIEILAGDTHTLDIMFNKSSKITVSIVVYYIILKLFAAQMGK